ncbi:MAG: ABC transporter permease [Thermoproteota archaeon]|nr:MAG: ABC transporter permease [Candidatus Korarchaeota archaeon]
MELREYVIKKSIFSLITFLFVLIFNFALPRMMPGDPLSHFMSSARLTPEMQEMVIKRFGLDKPLWDQFKIYIRNVFRGDFGVSYSFYPQTVMEVIMKRLPWTLALLLISTTISTILGVLTGIIAAWKRGSKLDVGILLFSLTFWSMPYYWWAMMLLLIFGLHLGWFPLGGAMTAGLSHPTFFSFLKDYLRHAALPIFALVVASYASRTLIMRNTMITVLGEDYILVAEAKGLPEKRIMFSHAARNAMLPIITMIALNFAFIVGGAVFTETVFSYPGVGRAIYQAVLHRDYPLLQGAFFILSITVILANFIADLLYAKLDPRIKY